MFKHLKYIDGNSDKFWEIETSGASHTVTYGRNGTDGQSKTKSFDSEEACLKDAEKLINEKTKKGYSEDDIRLKSASRVGFACHGDTKNLLRKLNMEKRLGKVIRKRKRKPPFPGMRPDQKKSVEDIVCTDFDIEDAKIIRLLDYNIQDSIIGENDDGTPKKRIAIRYNLCAHVEHPGDEDEDPVYTWTEEEFYSFSGSKVMIDQAENDFSKDDLPIATVIREFKNQMKKKFYKFT